MRLAYAVLTFIAVVCEVHSWTYCESECVCRYHDRVDEDFVRQHVDCSYKRNVLGGNFTLPIKAYALDLSSNGLKVIRSGHFLRSKYLEELVLRNNEITEIEADSLVFPELKRLDLSNNRLQTLDRAVFTSIRKLDYLNLANNNFVSLSKLTLHPLSELREITLDNNNIGAGLADADLFDRSGFGLTNKIKKISINGINLNSVHDNFFIDAYDLRELLICNNNLTNLFEVPFTLEYLDVSDNPITEISGEDLYDLTALKVLKLNNLSISEVAAYTFAPLHALTKLELERNLNLTEFSVLAFGQEVLEDADDFLLEELSLKSSRLHTLNKKLEVPFGRLSRLDLQGNPWNCDCKITWIKQFQMKPNDYEHLRCYTPKSLFNSKIFELNPMSLKCVRGERRAGLAVGLIAFCMFCSAAALWLFWYVPVCQSRGRFVSTMYSPTAAYAVLPVHATPREM